MDRMRARHFLLSLALIASAELAAAAQTPTTGRLTGTVKDPSGEVIPGADIQAKNPQRGSQFRAFTNEAGVWGILSVPRGSYTVSVNAQGFKTSTFNEIEVGAGAAATLWSLFGK